MKLRVIATILMSLGLYVMLKSWNMSVSIDDSGIVNFNLMNQRQNGLILGGIAFMAGIILFATYKIKRTRQDDIDEIERNKKGLADLKKQTADGVSFLSKLNGTLVDEMNSFRDAFFTRLLVGIVAGICSMYFLVVAFESIFVIMPFTLIFVGLAMRKMPSNIALRKMLFVAMVPSGLLFSFVVVRLVAYLPNSLSNPEFFPLILPFIIVLTGYLYFKGEAKSEKKSEVIPALDN